MDVIYGEMHTTLIRDMIEERIREDHKKYKFDYILSEEAGEGQYFTKKDLRDAIRCTMYSISDRSYRLGIELGLPVIGIDKWRGLDLLGTSNMKRKHKIRELHMLSVIDQYYELGNVCVLIGAVHIRKEREYKEDPSASIVYSSLKHNCLIHKYIDEQYMDTDIPSTDRKGIKIITTNLL